MDFVQVTIVGSHIHRIKMLRDILRKWAPVCYVHTDIDDFRQHFREDLNSLYLVDVEMIPNRGNREVGDEITSVNVAFYYSKHSFHLMSSSRLMNSCGHFDIESKDLSRKIFDIIRSLKTRREREREVSKLKVELHGVRSRYRQSLEASEQMKQTFDRQQLLEKLVSEIDHRCQRGDFLEALGQVFEGCEFIHKYALFELVPNGQKLVSPPLFGYKVQRFPMLWLGKDHGVLGIDRYAQALAHQTAVDHFGREVVSMGLKLRSQTLPKLLIYLVVDARAFCGLDWNSFQLFLNGFYHRSELRSEMPYRPNRRSPLISQWEFYDLLIDGESDREKRFCIFVLELHRLATAVTKKKVGGFQWRNFYEKFTGTLEETSRSDYSASPLGRWGMAFFVSDEYRESFRSFLSEFSEKFPYWKFFDDPDEILALDLHPQIKILSADRKEFFDYMAKTDRENANRYLADREKKAHRERLRAGLQEAGH